MRLMQLHRRYIARRADNAREQYKTRKGEREGGRENPGHDDLTPAAKAFSLFGRIIHVSLVSRRPENKYAPSFFVALVQWRMKLSRIVVYQSWVSRRSGRAPEISGARKGRAREEDTSVRGPDVLR